MRQTRRALLIAVPFLAVALAACGDDGPYVPEGAGTLPPIETIAPPAYDVATGADDIVINARYEGGFVPMDVAFAQTPITMITGDDRSFSTGPVIAIYPGPLLPNVQVQSITPEAVQQLLAEADELGLLADVTYERPDNIADAPDTVVDITVGDTTYTHQAYALGIGGEDETDEARANLLEFVSSLIDLQGTVGADAVGPSEAFAPADYLIRATPIDPATLDTDVEPTLVDWPQDADVRLADAEDCAVVPADVGDALFVDATTLTFFVDDDVTYSVAAVQQLPGRTC